MVLCAWISRAVGPVGLRKGNLGGVICMTFSLSRFSFANAIHSPNLFLLSQDTRSFAVERGQMYFQLQGERDEDGVVDWQSVLERQRISFMEKFLVGSDELDALIR